MNPRPPNHLIGQTFGKLTIKSLSRIFRGKAESKRSCYVAIAKCSCGNEHEALVGHIVSGNTSSCGCDKSHYTKMSGANSTSFTGYKDIPARFWNRYKYRAPGRGLNFTISIEYAWEVLESQNGRCALSGEPLAFGVAADSSTNTASIDRIDNKLGYEVGNIQWVHKHLNIMRHTQELDLFIDWCRLVANTARSGILTEPYVIKSLQIPIINQLQKSQTPPHPNFKGVGEMGSRFWTTYKDGAARRDLPFKISMEYAWDLFKEQDRRCVLSGVSLVFGPSSRLPETSASIDRIDNSLGYIPDNIQWVHKKINVMRMALTRKEFIDWCLAIASYND